MKGRTENAPKRGILVFRMILFFLAHSFFLMGFMLVVFPSLLSQVAGEQHPVILGMLRGAGGSILPYALLYILIAVKPLEYRWIAYIIGFANVLAIGLDLTSVFLKEYLFSYAMLDVPFELLSLVTIIQFYWRARSKKRIELARIDHS